jgi:purine-binding chemotaxis protein CheW
VLPLWPQDWYRCQTVLVPLLPYAAVGGWRQLCLTGWGKVPGGRWILDADAPGLAHRALTRFTRAVQLGAGTLSLDRRSGASGDVALLVFRLGDQRFALPCDRVSEIVPAATIQALPDAPGLVEGILNLRGTIVAVLDVRQRFGLEASPLHHEQHFIIATIGPGRVALRVDRAEDVVTVEESAVRAHSGAPGVRHVAGVAVVDDGLLVIQDLDRFLGLDEARELDAALGAVALPA